MLLINCKVELKPKWAKHCLLTEAGADNVNKDPDNINKDPDNINFTIKNKKLYVSVVILSARDNQKLSKLLSREFEGSLHWNEYKTKSGNKNAANKFRYFLKSNLVRVKRFFALVYSNQHDNSKRFKIFFSKRYFLPN